MTEEEMKQWIDKASYKGLLSKWRFAPTGNPFFKGQMGAYYVTAMATKREEIGDTEHVKISKEIGWCKREYNNEDCL